MSSSNPLNPVNPANPPSWWRKLCRVADRIIVTGDLPAHRPAALEALRRWVAAGVTHVVDVREEANDEAFVGQHAPSITYRWAPTHDSGYSQPDSWFTDTVEWIIDVLNSDPDAVILIHCHMGVNRAPSMTMAVLMELGYSAIEALEAIRSARPIAGIIYADQAADWFHRRHGSEAHVRHADRQAIETWHDDNPVDVAWIVSRIARHEYAEEYADMFGEGDAA